MPEQDARTMGGAEARLVMADRKRAVTALVSRGRTLRQAAEELNLTFGQVKSAYRAVLRELQASYLKDAEKHRARLVLANRAAQAELWRAYERVRDQGTVSRKGKLLPAPGATPTVEEVTQSTDPGAEARFLTGILKAQEQEAKLLGVYKDADEDKDRKGTTLNVERGIIVMNNAELGPSEWVRSLPRVFAQQGKGVLDVPAEPVPEESSK